MAMRRPGPFAPLAAFYADDEKIMEAGEDAELLYVRMLAYAARTPLTEGWISDRVVVSRLGILPRDAGNGAGTVPGTDAGSRAGVLERVGLIERERAGWRIVSWLKWNRSAAEMGRERDRDRKRKTSGDDGTRAGNGAGTDAGSRAGTDAGIRGDRSDTDTDTERTPPNPPAGGEGDPTRRPKADPPGFADFWDAYPRKVGKDKARAKWVQACKRADPDTIIQALHDALAASGAMLGATEARYIPYPTTWLNQGRWQDEVTPTPPPEPPRPSAWDYAPLTT